MVKIATFSIPLLSYYTTINLADDKDSADGKPLGPVPDDDLIPLHIDEKFKVNR